MHDPNKTLPGRTRPPLDQDRVANWVRGQIVRAALPPGARLAPRTDLVTRFGVSSLTVQRAMDQLVEDGFIETRGPLGSFAASLPPHLHRIGLAFSPGRHSPAWSNLWEALLAAADRVQREGVYRFATYTGVDAHVDSVDCRLLERDISRRALAGVLFDHYSMEIVAQRKIDCCGLPVVAITHDLANAAIPAITPRHEQYFDIALRQAKASGCRAPAIVALANSDVWAMIPGLRRLFKKHGLSWRAEWMQGAPVPGSEWAEQSVRLLFSDHARQRPDVLLVADDNLAPTVAATLKALSIRVPAQLRVMALCNYPRIPSVAMEFEWVGFDLVQMLRSAIVSFRRQREGLATPKTTLIPARYYGLASIST